jgi:DNA-binding transcriptional LysR family regulator
MFTNDFLIGCAKDCDRLASVWLMLNIHEMQVFLVAAETENFSEAGRRLNISQPAVSMQIRSLEQTLGTDLFHRSGRHISLTETGHALVPMARDLVSRAIQIEETMASMQGKVIGLLKLGCSTASGKYILPKLIAGLRERHSAVEVVCHVNTRDHALRMLLEGEAHVAITSLREPFKDIEYRPFIQDQIVLVVPAGHPWTMHGIIRPADLVGENFILREEGSGTREALKDGLTQHNLSLDYLNAVMVLGNSEAIAVAVQEGIGVAFISGMVAADAFRSGALVPVAVEGMALSQTLYMARHTGRPATSAQTAFWEFAFAPENEDLRELPSHILSEGYVA